MWQKWEEDFSKVKHTYRQSFAGFCQNPEFCINCFTTNISSEDVEQQEFSHTADGSVNQNNHFGKLYV